MILWRQRADCVDLGLWPEVCMVKRAKEQLSQFFRLIPV